MTRTIVVSASFAANGGLLVLQLAAVKLLVPFAGSSLGTWSAVIAATLAGLAIGSGTGGRGSPRRLAGLLGLAAIAAYLMTWLPDLFRTMNYRAWPIGLRIPAFAAVLCLPAAFFVGRVTPAAAALVGGRAAAAAGLVYAAAAAGSLLGNALAGFVLFANWELDDVITGVAVLFAAAGFLCRAVPKDVVPAEVAPGRREAKLEAIAFAVGFAGMAVEIAAARVLAQVVGVSVYTWTGVIGVVLFGTAVGNLVGGRMANGNRGRLAFSLAAAAAAVVGVLPLFFVLSGVEAFAGVPPAGRAAAWAAAIFFVPAVALGTVTPQLAGCGGRVGRVSGWAAAGAVVGTLAAGFVLVPGVGMYRTILAAAFVVSVTAFAADRVWKRKGLLYAAAAPAGACVVGFLVLTPDATKIDRETEYFAVRVVPDTARANTKTLQLDRLVHSRVDLTDPLYLHYPHERIQLEFLAKLAKPDAAVLVIGGGGYTFPRAAKARVPGAVVDVVELDPGVTATAVEHLGLDANLNLGVWHGDGRRFLAEHAEPGKYDLITLDAVNDLCVPAHLLTTECNRLVMRAMARDGIYLVSVIDHPTRGKLWPAVATTLQQTFRYVEMIPPAPDPDNPDRPQVLIVYAAMNPSRRPGTKYISELSCYLTDQYAPVETLSAAVYRARER